jgi:hypothetical protein
MNDADEARRRSAGRATGSIVLLLLLLVGAGGWNYHRNLQLEKASENDRPYRSYAVEDLEALRAATSAELDAMRARFEAARRQRARPVGDIGSISDNVEQFENTTRASTAIRDAAARVAEREGQLAALDRELQLRAQMGQGLARHLKLLTTI